MHVIALLRSRVALRHLLILVLVAFILRFILLTDIPYRVDGDASMFALEGLKYIAQRPPLIGVGWMGHTNLYIYLVGWVLHIAPNDLLALRILSATGGVLGVVATYFFIRKLLSETVGFWAGLFLAVLPFHLVFSRNGMEVVWMTFFAPIVLFLILSDKKYNALLAGILTGVAQYIAPGNRIIPLFVILLLVLLLLHKKLRWKQLLLKISIWLIGFLVIYAPMVFYFIQHPYEYFVRVHIVNILQEGRLQTLIADGKLLEYISNCFLVFFMPVNGTLFWFYRTSYLDTLVAIFFVIGLFAGMMHIKKWQIQFLFLYLLLIVILGGVLTVMSPMPSRYIIVFPAVMGFVAYGIHWFISELPHASPRHSVSNIFIIILIVTSLLSYLKHEYWDTWRNEYILHEQTATYAGRYLSQKETEKIYFMGTDWFTPGAALRFLTKKDIIEVSLEKAKKTRFSKHSAIIIVPERKDDLLWLQKHYPHGQLTILTNPLGRLLGYLLELE